MKQLILCILIGVVLFSLVACKDHKDGKGDVKSEWSLEKDGLGAGDGQLGKEMWDSHFPPTSQPD